MYLTAASKRTLERAATARALRDQERRWKEIGETLGCSPQRAGVRKVRFHDLRHTFGTRMAAAGIPIRTLQAWMGHSDIKTTMV
jgi:integrase